MVKSWLTHERMTTALGALGALALSLVVAFGTANADVRMYRGGDAPVSKTLKRPNSSVRIVNVRPRVRGDRQELFGATPIRKPYLLRVNPERETLEPGALNRPLKQPDHQVNVLRAGQSALH